MDAAVLALAAIACAALSGVPGLRWRKQGPRLAAIGLGLGGALAVAAGISALFAPARLGTAAEGVMAGWRGSLLVDGISSVFLIACGLVAGAVGLYAVGYWRDAEQPAAPWTRLLAGLLVAGILGVFAAGDLLTFLIAWEVMSLCAFGLVATKHREAESRNAAWLYLATTRAATLSLIAACALWLQLTGGPGWSTLSTAVAGSAAGVTMLALFLVAFLIKAGAVPGHIWLPPAHAAAPSHVSAIMSGVLIKTGIYGLCRLGSCLEAPPLWWGGIIFGLGAASTLLGVIWALGSHDLKRLLAFHSIENIGIILLGLGLAMVGRSLGDPLLVVLGLSGALLHVLNHALFKSLLFLGAGAVDHACGTRQIDRLGGLARRMPTTAACFLIAAAAICALPPFNGFVSEYLVYLGLFHGAVGGWTWALAGLVALALTGGLALACFAKAAGIVFLGEPRTPAAARAHECSPSERAAMAMLAGCCLAIGVGLPALVPALQAAANASLPTGTVSLPSLDAGWYVTLAAAVLLAGGLLLWRWQQRAVQGAGATGTWDCGYAEPTARMQYTATSFAAPLAEQVAGVMLVERHRPQLAGGARFPATASFSDHPRDPVLERFLRPAAEAVAWLARGLRVVHGGWVHLYLLYVALTFAALLLWSLA